MISVIVPVHNVEEFLPRCINSILKSTYSDLEILLIENGSTDNSLNICNSFAEKYDNIRVYVADKTGVSHARNIGLDHAKGEYISFIDSDDYISPLMYEKLITAIINHNADFAFCDYETGNIADFDFTLNHSNSTEIISADKYLYNIYVKDMTSYVAVWNIIIKREIVDDLRFDETLSMGEDRLFSAQCAAKCKTIVHCPVKQYYYYIGNSQSICHSVDLDLRTNLICQEKDYNYFKSSNIVPPPRPILDYIAIFMLRRVDFRLKNARGGYDGIRYPDQIEKLKPLVKKYLKLVWKAKHISKFDKIISLINHYFPALFNFLVKIKNK